MARSKRIVHPIRKRCEIGKVGEKYSEQGVVVTESALRTNATTTTTTVQSATAVVLAISGRY